MALAYVPHVSPDLDGSAEIIPFPEFEVSRADLICLGSHLMWAQGYVNYLYDNGDHGGRSMPKGDAALEWHLGPLAVRAGGWDSFARDKMRPEDYQRSTHFVIEHALEGGRDRLELGVDPYNYIKYGSYLWQGNGGHNRPAPDAEFAGVYHAHEQKVSRRAAELLKLFRQGVLKPSVQVRGLWRGSPPHPLPPQISALPRFITQD